MSAASIEQAAFATSPSPITQLLRAPAEVARICLSGHGLRPLASASLLAIVGGGGLFGATLGMQRSAMQALYSGLKVPLAMLITLALCAPAYHALANLHGRVGTFRTAVAVLLTACARACLVLLAFVPVLMVAIDSGFDYHSVAFGAALAYALSGLAGLGILLRAIGRRRGALSLALALTGTFALAGGQVAWSLRPYLGRPSQTEVPFVRAPDGVFTEQVWTSGRSAVGDYEETAE